MRKVFFWLFLFTATWLGAAAPSLRLQDIPSIMERFFHFHVENKELSPLLIQRSMKIYLEQFDPDKSYVLYSEVAPYLEMSREKSQEIVGRLRQGDYSDFIALNQLAQRAIIRAQKLRKGLSLDMAKGDFSREMVRASGTAYASNVEELAERQKQRMGRFFLFHKARTSLETVERRSRVYALFEKRVRRQEFAYLFLQNDGSHLPREKIEHLLSLRVVKSFARSLDTHSSFFSQEEAMEMRTSLEKQFEGVGVVLSEGIDGIMISELVEGSPAKESNLLLENDLLVEVDGASVQDLSFEEVLDLLKAKDRGEIVLGVKRGVLSKKGEIVRVALQKKPIVLQDERIQVSYTRFGKGIIGKISLHAFYENSHGVSSERDIKRAIEGFRQKGELLGLVLDLRQNSGGFLSQAVKVTGLFISNGVVVISKYGQGDVHYLRNVAGKPFFSGPLVVLTSKMSASAAEIVAQALQDYGVGLVVGDPRTFGKGSIQYQTVTDERAQMFFKVTVGRYYTVSGKSPQIHGVQADIIVPSQYEPYKIGEQFLEYPLPPDQVASAYLDPLTDLDPRTRQIFQDRYLPSLQRVVSYWKKMLPELRSRSSARLLQSSGFQELLQKHARVKAKEHLLPVNTIDENAQMGKEDLQMGEAVFILEDMLLLDEARSSLQKTGSD